MFSLHGTAIGGGIAIARARVLESHRATAIRYRLTPEQIEPEIRRFDTALQSVRDAIEHVARHLPADAPSEAQALLDVHAMILDDPSFAEETREAVREHGWNAEWALTTQANELAAQFEAFEDEYLRERGRDVQQVTDRVLRALAGIDARTHSSSEPAILVASDIAPSDMLALKNAVGFGIDLGGTTSHTAILARSMNVPAVVGLHSASELIRDDDWLILDGQAGLVIVAPDEGVLQAYRDRQAAALVEHQKLKRLIHVPACTRDGVTISLQANIELPEEAEQAHEAGAAGVGLFRSEFLFMNRRELPSEDEQFEGYRAAVLGMRGKPVTIRTLDVGADKALDSDEIVVAPNPALGLRAIRYCLAEPTMFLMQLRAILRASAFGTVRLLIPMIAHLREIEQTLRLIDQAKAQLRDRRIAYDEHMAVGGMIEIPAAALSTAWFARRLDFFSIGTNDLIQYTLAIDRADHSVASLYDPFHPAVLQLVSMSIRAAHKAGKPVAVCGEMAGDWMATRMLLGMGLKDFSMHPASLLRVKQEVLASDCSQLMRRMAQYNDADDPSLVAGMLGELRAG